MSSNYTPITTNLKMDGVDIGSIYVTRNFLIDRYPELSDQLKSATMYCWGAGSSNSQLSYVQSDTSSPTILSSNNSNWRRLAVNNNSLHRAAIKTDGTLWLWGRNNAGQLGDTSTVNRVLIQATNNEWVDVACGLDFTISITYGLGGARQLYATGNNAVGQLGDGTITSRTTLAYVADYNAVQVSCGNYHTSFINASGQLLSMGYNAVGSLGDGSTIRKSAAVQTIAGGTNWKQVAAGGDRTCAVKVDGTLWGWGSNNYGELGDGTVTSKSSPVQTVTGGTNWKNVSCGETATGAIKTDGTLWMWGFNGSGQLGDNTVTSRSSPVQTVAGGTNWRQVNPSGNFCAAIKTDGTLWTWGFNDRGQLGDGTTVNKSSPVQTARGGTNWKTVTCTTGGVIAITDNSEDLWL